MISGKKESYSPIGQEREAFDLSKLSEGELLMLRSNVDSMLPVTKLSDMNLERELTLQFRASQELQARVIEDEHVAANQKAQVMNSVAATLQSLVKMQMEYYTPERLKKIETMLVKMLNTWPIEQASHFLDQYEKFLEEA